MIDYRKLLEDHKLLPVEAWSHFDLEHQPPSGPAERQRVIDQLRSEVGQINGIYAYKQEERWLYVGKGAPLFGRLKSHYRESFEPVPGDTKDNQWHRFFSSHTGRLTIYWTQVDSETDRQVFELALREVLKPVFYR